MKAAPSATARKISRPTALSLRDRLVYGAIAALIGCVLAVAASAFLALGFEASPPVRLIVLVSALYFSCVGFVRGPDAGFFAGEALAAVAGLGATQGGTYVGEPANPDKPAAWKSPLLLLVWIALVLLLTWRG